MRKLAVNALIVLIYFLKFQNLLLKKILFWQVYTIYGVLKMYHFNKEHFCVFTVTL